MTAEMERLVPFIYIYQNCCSKTNIRLWIIFALKKAAFFLFVRVTCYTSNLIDPPIKVTPICVAAAIASFCGKICFSEQLYK